MARKLPVRHVVHNYTKLDGTKVRGHTKGNGAKKVTYRPGSIVPEYLEDEIRKKNREFQIAEVRKLRKGAKVSPYLKAALKEISDALESGNLPLATDLTSVKSYIVGAMNTFKRRQFAEDAGYNKKEFGSDVYGILDTLHHNLAFETHTIPSGATIMTAAGSYGRGKPTHRSPTLKLINREHAEIYREAGK